MGKFLFVCVLVLSIFHCSMSSAYRSKRMPPECKQRNSRLFKSDINVFSEPPIAAMSNEIILQLSTKYQQKNFQVDCKSSSSYTLLENVTAKLIVKHDRQSTSGYSYYLSPSSSCFDSKKPKNTFTSCILDNNDKSTSIQIDKTEGTQWNCTLEVRINNEQQDIVFTSCTFQVHQRLSKKQIMTECLKKPTYYSINITLPREERTYFLFETKTETDKLIVKINLDMNGKEDKPRVYIDKRLLEINKINETTLVQNYVGYYYFVPNKKIVVKCDNSNTISALKLIWRTKDKIVNQTKYNADKQMIITPNETENNTILNCSYILNQMESNVIVHMYVRNEILENESTSIKVSTEPEQENKIEDQQNQPTEGFVIGVVTAFIILSLGIVAVWLWWKKKHNTNRHTTVPEEPIYAQPEPCVYAELELVESNSHQSRQGLSNNTEYATIVGVLSPSNHEYAIPK